MAVGRYAGQNPCSACRVDAQGRGLPRGHCGTGTGWGVKLAEGREGLLLAGGPCGCLWAECAPLWPPSQALGPVLLGGEFWNLFFFFFLNKTHPHSS